MKILVTEDSEEKLKSLVEFIESIGVDSSDILTAATMAEFSSKLDSDVGVCVIDIRIPAFEGAAAGQNGLGILQILNKAGVDRVKSLAISAYPEEFSELRPQFERSGCLLVSFFDEDVWQGALRLMVLQASAREQLDFIIFSALPKERRPYTALPQLRGSVVSKDGVNRYDIRIASRKGTVIELPHMGLVDAAITAAKYIDRYSPKIVGMSGICGGFPKNSTLGQLIISEASYEYQSGKWASDGFAQEPYQVPISERLRSLIRYNLEDEGLLRRLESDYVGTRPTSMTPPKLGLFTSGSAVIADKSYLDQVAALHRRVAGLDMEIFSIHRAGHLSRWNPDVLCAKVVVDMANKAKSDDLHDYGCHVSAKFLVEILEKYFQAT